MLLAELRGAPQASIDSLAGVFILARVSHGVVYMLDKAALRSVAWAVGLCCVVGLFVIAGRAA